MNGGALPGARRPRSVADDFAENSNVADRDGDHSYQIVNFPLRLYRTSREGQLPKVNGISLPGVSEIACDHSLTPRSRLLRVIATLTGGAVLLAGTVVGTDDDFPFGPFRVYATAEHLDAPVADTRVDAVDTAGHRRTLTQTDTGIRRAEIEGQLDRFATQPALLSTVARAYERRNPGAAPLAAITVVVRWHEVRDGRSTGRYHDETRVVWRR
jgi:hypothetical protein